MKITLQGYFYMEFMCSFYCLPPFYERGSIENWFIRVVMAIFVYRGVWGLEINYPSMLFETNLEFTTVFGKKDFNFQFSAEYQLEY